MHTFFDGKGIFFVLRRAASMDLYNDHHENNNDANAAV